MQKGLLRKLLGRMHGTVRDENQLHAAIVELVAMDDAVKYSTVQNWYPGDEDGKGIYNRDQARALSGRTQRFRGPRWKQDRRLLGSIQAASFKVMAHLGEFYSVALSNNRQQADTGTKMIHIGKNDQLIRKESRQEKGSKPTEEWFGS